MTGKVIGLALGFRGFGRMGGVLAVAGALSSSVLFSSLILIFFTSATILISSSSGVFLLFSSSCIRSASSSSSCTIFTQEMVLVSTSLWSSQKIALRAGSRSGPGASGSSRITTFLLDRVCSSEWDRLVL